MYLRLTALTALIALAVASEARAVKILVTVSPEQGARGITFTMRPVDDQMTRFTITRDPAKADTPRDPQLILVRRASLKVSDGKQVILKTSLEPRKNEQGHLVYQFDVATTYVNTTDCAISEVEDYRDRTGYLGGGTFYRFSTDGRSELDRTLDDLKKAIEPRQ